MKKDHHFKVRSMGSTLLRQMDGFPQNYKTCQKRNVTLVAPEIRLRYSHNLKSGCLMKNNVKIERKLLTKPVQNRFYNALFNIYRSKKKHENFRIH